MAVATQRVVASRVLGALVALLLLTGVASLKDPRADIRGTAPAIANPPAGYGAEDGANATGVLQRVEGIIARVDDDVREAFSLRRLQQLYDLSCGSYGSYGSCTVVQQGSKSVSQRCRTFAVSGCSPTGGNPPAFKVAQLETSPCICESDDDDDDDIVTKDSFAPSPNTNTFIGNDGGGGGGGGLDNYAYLNNFNFGPSTIASLSKDARLLQKVVRKNCVSVSNPSSFKGRKLQLQASLCMEMDGETECTTSGCAQPVDCAGSWQGYGACQYDQTSHKNRRCNTYSVAWTASGGGESCPFANGQKMCTEGGCNQPVDCSGSWSAYGSCHHQADHKNRRCRSYGITTNAAHSGHGCPYAHAAKQCIEQGCAQPVDCVGSWSKYGACIHDSGTHKNRRCRKFLVTKTAAHNGYQCPYANQAQQCTVGGCAQPVDCVGSWDPFSPCQKALIDLQDYGDFQDMLEDRRLQINSLYENRRFRRYRVSVNAANNGYGCPFAHMYTQWDKSGCSQPVDCVGAWSAFSTCSHDNSDHKNRRCRTYKVVMNAESNGHACPHTHGFEQCTTGGCSQPVDCVGSWLSYGSCTYHASAHKNKRCKNYAVTKASSYNGYGCPYANGHEMCTTSGCIQPVDCVGSWNSYGDCKHYQPSHKNRRCKQWIVGKHAAHNGYDCPYDHGYETCTYSGCIQPIDCVGQWGSFSQCKHSLASGANERCKTYKTVTNQAHNGYACPYTNNHVSCTQSGCSQPVDCIGAWQSYSSCNHDNSDHKNKRCKSYKVERESAHNGYTCPYADEYTACTVDGCEQPVDCEGSWSDYGMCLSNDKFVLAEVGDDDDDDDDDDDHVFHVYSEVSVMQLGLQAKKKKNAACKMYKIHKNASNNGYSCQWPDAHKVCSTLLCEQPLDCVGTWSNYGACKHDDETHQNMKCRHYEHQIQPAFNGEGCPYKKGYEECTMSGCPQPVDCVGAWDAYDECHYVDADHENERCRVYRVSQAALHNGYACPHADALQQCTKSGCGQPVDCEGEWSAYEACYYDADQHKNLQCKAYVIFKSPDMNGKDCEFASGVKECVFDACEQPVDCSGDFSNYGNCFYDEGDHQNKRCRYYGILQHSDHNGFSCPYSHDYQQCTTDGCNQPIDCIGSWGTFGQCEHSPTDHANKRCRNYNVERKAEKNGYSCPFSDAYMQCTTSTCPQPVDCAGSWAQYGTCEHETNTHENRRCRLYKVSTQSMHYGHACPYTHDYEQCTSEECVQPVDCVGAWEEYEKCYLVIPDNIDEIDLSLSEKTLDELKFFLDIDMLDEKISDGEEHSDFIIDNKSFDEIVMPKQLSVFDQDLEKKILQANIEKFQVAHNQRCRKYRVVQSASHNGYACPHADALQQCTKSGCGQPVDCQGAWSPFENCLHRADSHKNERCRTYKVTTKSDLDGTQCPHADGEMDCSVSGCSQPVDCVGTWLASLECSKMEDSDVFSSCRTYVVTTPSASHGLNCPFENNFEECNDCEGHDEDVGYSQDSSGEATSQTDGQTSEEMTDGDTVNTNEEDAVKTASFMSGPLLIALIAVPTLCVMLLCAHFYRKKKRRFGDSAPLIQSPRYHSLLGNTQNNMVSMPGNRNERQTILQNPMFSWNDSRKQSSFQNPAFSQNWGSGEGSESYENEMYGEEQDSLMNADTRADSSWCNPLFDSMNDTPKGRERSGAVEDLGHDMNALYDYLDGLAAQDTGTEEQIEIQEIRRQVEAAMVTWNEVGESFGDGMQQENVHSASFENFQDNLLKIKQSLNKIEQRAFLSSGIKHDDKGGLSSIINQARAKLRKVDVVREKQSTKTDREGADVEWKQMRQKLRAIGKFKASADFMLNG